MIQVTPTTRGPGVTKEETKGSGGGGGGGAESVQQRRGFDLQVRGQRGGGENAGAGAEAGRVPGRDRLHCLDLQTSNVTGGFLEDRRIQGRGLDLSQK